MGNGMSNLLPRLNNRQIKGMAMDQDGTQRNLSAAHDLNIVLDPDLKCGNNRGTPLYRYLHNREPRWSRFIEEFRSTIRELKSSRRFKDIRQRNIFARMRVAYMGIVNHRLSIDLVAASLRQREFATKITSAECAGMDSPFALYKATTRYHKFMLLMNRGSKKRFLVPTMDIDLCWHTHQLFARPYRDWCI